MLCHTSLKLLCLRHPGIFDQRLWRALALRLGLHTIRRRLQRYLLRFGGFYLSDELRSLFWREIRECLVVIM